MSDEMLNGIKDLVSEAIKTQNKLRHVYAMKKLGSQDKQNMWQLVLDLMTEQKGCCAFSSITICFIAKFGSQAKLERHDDKLGFEVPGNACLVSHLLAGKFETKILNHATGVEGTYEAKWNRERFFLFGGTCFGEESLSFSNLPPAELKKHETAMLDIMAEAAEEKKRVAALRAANANAVNTNAPKPTKLAQSEKAKRNAAEARAKQMRVRYIALWRRAITQVLADLASVKPIVALTPKGKNASVVAEAELRVYAPKLAKKKAPPVRDAVGDVKRVVDKDANLASLAAAKDAKTAASEADAAAREARAEARRIAREIGGW